MCQTTPACPLLRTASMVLRDRLGDREVLVRLGDPLDQPVVGPGERDVAAQQLDEPRRAGTARAAAELIGEVLVAVPAAA